MVMIKKKSFNYVFSETEIEGFMDKPEANLEFSDFVTLVETISYQLNESHASGTVLISKYTKDNQLIHAEKFVLPLPDSTDFDKILEPFSSKKPPKPAKKKKNTEKNKPDSRKLSFEQLPVQMILLLGFLLLSVCVFGVGLTINHSIHQANQQQIRLTQKLLLSQLESDGRYGRVAQKMTEFGYGKEQVGAMYIDNRQFEQAMETDSNALDDVLQKIETLAGNEQKVYLERLKQSGLLTEEQRLKIDLRLALLNQDADYLSKNKKNIDSQALADSIVKYFASVQKYEEAAAVLEDFPNDDLEKVIAREATDYHVKQLETALDTAKEAVKEKQGALDAKNQQISDLNKQLDDINKNEEDKDKGTHAEEKQKEIDTAKNAQENLSSELAELKKAQEQAQKSLDDFTKK